MTEGKASWYSRPDFSEHNSEENEFRTTERSESSSLELEAMILPLQGDTIQDSLTDTPATQKAANSVQKDKDSDTFLQVLHDNSSVIVSRGPGGSVKISKAPDSGGTSKQPSPHAYLITFRRSLFELPWTMLKQLHSSDCWR